MIYPENSSNTIFVGQANTVFVFGQDDNAHSVISKLVATLLDQTNSDRILFGGAPVFDEKSKAHIVDIILPVVDGVVKRLGLPKRCFDLSIVDLEVTSVLGITFTVSGFSADLPIFVALLSAALQIPIPTDFVSTGHIASPHGDIRMVKGIQAKLASAIKDVNIKAFIHPAIDQDNSLGTLSPHEKAIVSDAITKARRDIETVAVKNIYELVKVVFPEDLIILESLRQSFCNLSFPRHLKDTAIGKAAYFFGEGTYKRFWKTLEGQMLSGESNKAKELISALISHHVKQKTYPKRFGEVLNNIVRSLPPETIRLRIDFPLITISQFTALGQFAEESDHEDLQLLFSVGFEKYIRPNLKDIDPDISKRTNNNVSKPQVQSIVSEIDADALTIMFGIPIDSARATYMLESVRVKNSDDFAKTITSFYIHLLRHTQKTYDSVSVRNAEAEAFALIERTFSNKGGFKGALSEAKHATNGGLRKILDMMTEQFKHEEQKKHVNYVLKSALDPLDWDSKVSFVKGIVSTLQHVLPQEIQSQPPERFAVHYELIVNAYVESINDLNSIFRRL